MPYNFTSLPEVQTVDELRQHLTEELQRISQSMNDATELELRASRHEPDRPREGMIVHADGTSWDPGSGQGTYRYQNGLWVKIPSPSDIPSLVKTVTLVGDTNYTILSTDTIVLINAAFTTTRTWTLPAASNVPPQHDIYVFDRQGTLTTANQLIVQRAGSDTLNAAGTSINLSTVTTGLRFISDGVSKWTYEILFTGVNSILNRLSETQGVIPFRGAAAWSVVGPGTATHVLTSNGAAADPSFQALPAGGGLTLISTTNAPAAANFDITGLGGYKILLVAMNGLTQATGTRQHNVALSGNNGSTFGTARQPVNLSFVSGALVYGCYLITRTDQANNQMMLSNAAASTAVTVVESGSLGPINALRFTWGGGGGNFTGGSIDMYGLK